MRGPRLTFRQWVGWIGIAAILIVTAATAVWRGDILRAGMDPQVPFQTYSPPPAPDYRSDAAWALRDARLPTSGQASVFFLHSTTYDGGRHWNAPIDDREAGGYLRRVVLPNYAGPFAAAGAVSAPLYRQGSLYTRLTLREDAREARAFSYRDVVASFEVWLGAHPDGPIILVGVEQGGELLARLIRDRVAGDPALRRRLAAAYLIDVVVPAAPAALGGVPACMRREQAGCAVVYSPVNQNNDGAARSRLRRALVWDGQGRLIELGDRPALCVNPVSGGPMPAQARAHRGATNATGLEWSAKPALMAREVETECRDGLLRHSQPDTESFQSRGTWADRRKSRPYNLFYGDLEIDAQTRTAVWTRAAA